MTSRRICLGLAVAACTLDASAPAALVLEGATIVSSGRRRTTASIVIEVGRITAVGPVGQLTTPKGARVIDVRGRFIVPCRGTDVVLGWFG